MVRHHLAEQTAPRLGKVQAVGAAILAADQQAGLLQPVQQLADVALGDQQRVRQVLLALSLGRAHVGDDVELGLAQAPAAQVFAGGTLHLASDAQQAQPGQYRRLPQPAPPRRRLL